MIHTDPIADMLTRIRNAILAEKKSVPVPLSKIKLEIAKILKAEGFVSGFKVESGTPESHIIIDLKYGPNKQSVIEGIKRISTPGRRVYVGADQLPKVLDGLGVAVLSTSTGIHSGRECRKRNIGGEVLLHVW
jgi:small subunit ribosomal protein S8